MTLGSRVTITFGDLVILGHYDRATGRSGRIEGDRISLPSTYSATTTDVIKARAASVSAGGNRKTTLELTTIETFDTPEEAWAALLEHERTWATLPEKANLTIEGLGTYVAVIRNRVPSVIRDKRLTIAYTFACGALTLAPAS